MSTPLEFKPIAKSFDFKGRASRREYWTFVVFWPLFFIIIIGGFICGTLSALHFYMALGVVQWISKVFGYALLLPFAAVSARRFHDMNHSGWWTLVGLIPGGIIVLLVAMMFKGTQGPNRFGEQPFQ